MKKLLFISIVCFLTRSVYAQNVPYEITSSKPFATGPRVEGIFEGRCPCKELATLLKASVSSECFKTKWGLTLLKDPATQKPTVYELDGSFYRNNSRKGSWQVIKGTKNDPNAIVYQLDIENSGTPLFLLKGDDNVLFILDQEKNLLVGNELFSYTFNRVEKKAKTANN